MVDLARYTLGLTLTPAREWAEDCLRRANGQVNNPDAYIRQALKNRRRDDKRTTENGHADEPAKAARCPVHWLEEPCDRATWPPRPATRIRHSWKCTRRGATIETVRTDPTGRARIVEQCTECGHDDLLDRIRTEHEPT